MCRKQGRIVLVGVTGLELSRDDFFKKELSFQVSCSYRTGPVRHRVRRQGARLSGRLRAMDRAAEFRSRARHDGGKTHRCGSADFHRFTLDRVAEAYGVVAGSEPSLKIMLDYPAASDVQGAVRDSRVTLVESGRTSSASAASLAFIGAGNYATAMLIPAFKDAGATLDTVVSTGGVSVAHAGNSDSVRPRPTPAPSSATRPSMRWWWPPPRLTRQVCRAGN